MYEILSEVEDYRTEGQSEYFIYIMNILAHENEFMVKVVSERYSDTLTSNIALYIGEDELKHKDIYIPTAGEFPRQAIIQYIEDECNEFI